MLELGKKNVDVDVFQKVKKSVKKFSVIQLIFFHERLWQAFFNCFFFSYEVWTGNINIDSFGRIVF